MKILLLCNKSPYPAREGGPMAMNSIVEGLIDNGHQVKILAVNSEKYNVSLEEIPEDYKKKTDIELIDVDLRIKKVDALLNLFTNKSYHVERFISKKFSDKLSSVLNTETFDIVQLETVFMAPYIPIIRELSKAMIVLRAHNIEHLIWKRLAKETKQIFKKFYINHLSKTLENYELDVLNQVDGVAAITRKDAQFFRGLTATPVIDIPYGIEIEDFTPKYEVGEKPNFFHIGSMNWMPNQEGIRWFLDSCWKDVINRNKDIQFYLAGRFMPDWLTNANSENLKVVGEVQDAKEFVSLHNVAIVPLLSGSGIRIKIIESMAMGKTVITTPVGAEGIAYTASQNIIITENAAQMIEAIINIASHPEKAEKIGRAARQLIEETHDNKKIVDRLLLFYKEIEPDSKMTVVNGDLSKDSIFAEKVFKENITE